MHPPYEALKNQDDPRYADELLKERRADAKIAHPLAHAFARQLTHLLPHVDRLADDAKALDHVYDKALCCGSERQVWIYFGAEWTQRQKEILSLNRPAFEIPFRLLHTLRYFRKRGEGFGGGPPASRRISRRS